MDSEAEICFRLWRVRRTLLEMCRDRGFDVSSDDVEMNLDTFKRTYAAGGTPMRSSLDFMVSKATPVEEESRMWIIFPEEPKIGVKSIRNCVIRMDETSVKRALIVLQSGMTPSAKKALLECAESGQLIQPFEEEELIVNITKHELVPRHVLLNEEEKADLLLRYKLKEQQLPRIKAADPVVRYYGYKRGQVVKIIRPSPIAGRSITYRLVF
eukprot:m.50457 g.50457  ORF g.50457 m.50457 type:complete len:212 (+) comp12907_c0_seq1:241-876(+)